MKLKNTLGLVIASFCTYTSETPAFELRATYCHNVIVVGGFDIFSIRPDTMPMSSRQMLDHPPYDYIDVIQRNGHSGAVFESRSSHDSLTSLCRTDGSWERFKRLTSPGLRWSVSGAPIYARPNVKRHLHLVPPVNAINKEIRHHLDKLYFAGMTYEDELYACYGGHRIGSLPIISAPTSHGASMTMARMLGEENRYIFCDHKGDWYQGPSSKHPLVVKAEKLIAENIRFTAWGVYKTRGGWSYYMGEELALIKHRDDKMRWNPSKHQTDPTKRFYF